MTTGKHSLAAAESVVLVTVVGASLSQCLQWGLGLRTFWQAFFGPETSQDSIILLKQLICSISNRNGTPGSILEEISSPRSATPPQSNSMLGILDSGDLGVLWGGIAS